MGFGFQDIGHLLAKAGEKEMTPDIKRQLEEMANDHSLNRSWSPHAEMTFMAGAVSSWELATKVTEDDERDAKEYSALWQPDNAEAADYLVTKAIVNVAHQSFLAGRRGIREAVEAAVKQERERCAEIVRRNSGDRHWNESQILNPTESGE